MCSLLCAKVTAYAKKRPPSFQSILLRLCNRTHLLSLITSQFDKWSVNTYGSWQLGSTTNYSMITNTLFYLASAVNAMIIYLLLYLFFQPQQQTVKVPSAGLELCSITVLERMTWRRHPQRRASHVAELPTHRALQPYLSMSTTDEPTATWLQHVFPWRLPLPVADWWITAKMKKKKMMKMKWSVDNLSIKLVASIQASQIETSVVEHL